MLAVKMGRREDLGYPQPSAPSPPRRASRAAYGYEYGYEWYGYAYQGLWYAYCATMSRSLVSKVCHVASALQAVHWCQKCVMWQVHHKPFTGVN